MPIDPAPAISAIARREARRVMAEHEGRHHAAGPPVPMPDYLQPLRGPLGYGDLRIAPSTEELRMVATILDHERLAGQCLVTMRDGSPWLELDVAVPHQVVAPDYQHAVGRQVMQPPPAPGVYRYAIWRYTGAAYRVGADGAVEDDPFLTHQPEET